MQSNRILNRAVPFILALVLAFGILPPQMGRAQDSGPAIYLPLVNSSRTASSTPGGVKPAPPNLNDGFFVSDTGSPSGDGTKSDPWDLQTALDHPGEVQPGDTIWLLEGVYGNGGSTIFKSRLKGAQDQPIVIRAVPGHRVRIDGSIQVLEPWSAFWGLEVMNSDTDRRSNQSTSHPEDINRKDGFDIFAQHTFLINNIIHDTRQGVGFWSEGPDSVMYGNIIYNNGWEAPDRGHGHGVYAQNESGLKQIQDNIIFSNFSGYGLHVYSTDGYLKGFQIEGNTIFNASLLVGSETNPASRIQIRGNSLYNGRVRLGYNAQVRNEDMVFQNNIIQHLDGSLFDVRQWRSLDFTGNQIIAGKIGFMPVSGGSYQWDQNTYRSPDSAAFSVDGSSRSWDEWKRATGFDSNSTFSTQAPGGVQVVVRPNQYEAKRANITVYNWDRQDNVIVDISAAGLKPGDTYTLRSVQDYFGKTITGVYDGGPISIPMKGWNVTRPIGWDQPLEPTTFPVFGAFVLTVN